MLLLLTLAVLCEGVHMAPLVRETAGMEMEGGDAEIQEELYQLLKEGLLNDTNNVEAIKDIFNFGGKKRLCIGLTYNITCTDENEADCDNAMTSFNCTAGYDYQVIWLSFDPNTMAGRILFDTAALDLRVLGLDWGGACDLSATNLAVQVPSLARLTCSVDHIQKAFKKLTKQLPKIADAAISTGSYALHFDPEGIDHFLMMYTIVATFAIYLPFIAAYSLCPAIVGKIKPGKHDTRKPKVYYQFWSMHIVMTGLAVYTVIDTVLHSHNPGIDHFWTICIPTAIGCLVFSIVHCCSGYRRLDVRTPTGCCRCHALCIKCCPGLVKYLSLLTLLLFFSFSILLLPTVILVFYLDPLHTIIRLPFILNSILYTNSLLALLLYQCEKCCFAITRSCDKSKEENEDNPYYSEFYMEYKQSKEDRCTGAAKLLCPPIGIMITLVMLVLFIVMVSGLFELRLTDFRANSEVQALILLVPTLLLLFGSWVKLDLFFDIGEEKSEKELLKDILDSMVEQRNDTTSPKQSQIEEKTGHELAFPADESGDDEDSYLVANVQ